MGVTAVTERRCSPLAASRAAGVRGGGFASGGRGWKASLLGPEERRKGREARGERRGRPGASGSRRRRERGGRPSGGGRGRGGRLWLRRGGGERREGCLQWTSSKLEAERLMATGCICVGQLVNIHVATAIGRATSAYTSPWTRENREHASTFTLATFAHIHGHGHTCRQR